MPKQKNISFWFIAISQRDRGEDAQCVIDSEEGSYSQSVGETR